MEIYIAPSEASPGAVLQREQVLEALAQMGLEVARAEEKAATGRLRAWWTLSFAGTDVTLQFQETDQGLVFATLEQSMVDSSDVPDRICRALETMGWEVDQENVG